jgi:hypothetical protein
MHRLAYIPYRLAYDLVSLFSRMLNAIVFGGSTAQTLSARAYIDGQDSVFWERIGQGINLLFFWQENHIADAWAAEVERARYTLERLEASYDREHS